MSEKKKGRDRPVRAEASGWKEGRREGGVGSNYSRPCLPIHHKTSRSLWIILIIMHCNVYYTPPASKLEYAKETTCKHLLSISKAANLSRLVQPHLIFFWCAMTKHVRPQLYIRLLILPPAAICINHQAAHMNYYFHIGRRVSTRASQSHNMRTTGRSAQYCFK